MIVASYKLERIPAAKSANIKIIYVKADLKKALQFGRLAGWLGPWEGVRQDHRQSIMSTDRQRPGRNRTIIILFKLNGK